MRRDIISTVTGLLALTLALGILFPLAITGVSQVAFPGNANGQQIHRRGRLVGSALIGQAFGDPVRRHGKIVLDTNGNPVTTPDARYFQTRPSGTLPADNAAGSAFANYGPNSVVTRDALAANLKAYLALERPYTPGLTVARVPVDAVDTSASGVDPDISPANAAIQAHRIAGVRHLPRAAVTALVARFTAGRGLGFSGEPSVDVLTLNLALDRLSGGR